MSERILEALDKLYLSTPYDFMNKIIGIEETYSRIIVKELLSVKKHLEVILSSISEGIFEVTAEAEIVYANPTAISVLGIPE